MAPIETERRAAQTACDVNGGQTAEDEAEDEAEDIFFSLRRYSSYSK